MDIFGTSGFGIPLRSVETPVANKPREATAREPPRSTDTKVNEMAKRVTGLNGIQYPY